MSRYEILPNILWKVENLWGNDKKYSPILSFMGMKWKLKFSCVPESGGVRSKLILKRLTSAYSGLDANFHVQTCLLKQYGAGEFFKQTMSATLSYKEWCIWNQDKTEVERSEHVYYRNSIVFLIVITPGEKWISLLQSCCRKNPETVEIPTCMKSLCEDIGNLFDSDVQSDVVLVCGDRKFNAHRSVLSARSEVFTAMFRSDMRESREGTVNITDAEPSILEQFLLYVYSGEISNLSVDSARQIYALADKYAVEALKMKCAFYVMENCKTGNERQTANCATLQTEVDSEKAAIREKEVLKELFLSKEWNELSQECPKLAAEMCKPLMEKEVQCTTSVALDSCLPLNADMTADVASI